MDAGRVLEMSPQEGSTEDIAPLIRKAVRGHGERVPYPTF